LFEIAGHVIPPEQKAQMEQKQASPPRPLCPKNIDFAQPSLNLLCVTKLAVKLSESSPSKPRSDRRQAG
jgi:hypothetical protein